MHDALVATGMKVVAIMSGVNLISASTELPDASVLLNVITVILLIVFGPRYVRVTRLRQQIEELKTACEVSDISKKAVHEELIGAQHRADHAAEKARALEKENAEWKARYDEQHRYTAGPALSEILTVLQENRDFYEQIVTDNQKLISLVVSHTKEG